MSRNVLSEKLDQVEIDIHLTHDEDFCNFIEGATRTAKKGLNLSQLIMAIFDNPDDVQWVLDDGYFDAGSVLPDVIKHRFKIFQASISRRAKRRSDAVERLNRLAEKIAPFIDEIYGKEG